MKKSIHGVLMLFSITNEEHAIMSI